MPERIVILAKNIEPELVAQLRELANVPVLADVFHIVDLASGPISELIEELAERWVIIVGSVAVPIAVGIDDPRLLHWRHGPPFKAHAILPNPMRSFVPWWRDPANAQRAKTFMRYAMSMSRHDVPRKICP